MKCEIWIVLNNDGTTILCDSKEEMDCYANLSSTQCLEGPYILSAERIRQEQEYKVEKSRKLKNNYNFVTGVLDEK